MIALLTTEFTKLKRTATLWLVVLIPAFVLMMALLTLLGDYAHWIPRPPRPLADEWLQALRPWWTLWSALIVLLLIVMETVGLAAPEHAGKHWKQLYSLPVPRWRFYAAKTMVCLLLIGASFLIFAVGVLALALLRSALFHRDLASAIPWPLILRVAARAYLASAPVIAIQMWIAMRYPGFAIPLLAALGATIAGTILGQLHLTGWWPWLMPLDSLPWGAIDHVPASPFISPLAFLLLFALAARFAARSEII